MIDTDLLKITIITHIYNKWSASKYMPCVIVIVIKYEFNCIGDIKYTYGFCQQNYIQYVKIFMHIIKRQTIWGKMMPDILILNTKGVIFMCIQDTLHPPCVLWTDKKPSPTPGQSTDDPSGNTQMEN